MKADRTPEASDEKVAGNAFERFESFARRLVSVPRKELDRKAKAHEQKRKRSA